MSLERFCRKPIASVVSTQSVRQAAQVMHERHVGALVVVDERARPVGMLTDRDVVCRVVAAQRDPGATPVAAVMSPEPVVVRASEQMDAAFFAMRQRGVRRLPVVDSEGRVAGVVSMDDLLVLLSGDLAQLAGAVRSNQGP